MKKIAGIFGAWLFGNATWILALVNFLWMLVKNHQLFSWWYVIGSAILFALSFALALFGIIND